MPETALQVTPVHSSQERDFQALMQAHHYLGALPKIGDTIWYVATAKDQWLALLSFSAPALKCSARDKWIGWSYRHQHNRLHLIANNSRFLILPEHHHPNLASQILSYCRLCIQQDWLERFGYPLLLLETFVDPDRFHGTIYRASIVWFSIMRSYGRYAIFAFYKRRLFDSYDCLLDETRLVRYLFAKEW